MVRTKRACQVCGKSFYGSVDCFYCAKCSQQKKNDTVIKIRVCQDCNVKFYGGPRAIRCPNCAHNAQRETNRQHKKSGTKRPIGSIDKCVICGSDYTVASGRQKYCSDACQRKGVLEWQREHKKNYHKISGQDIQKQQRRNDTKKICAYCLRSFSTNTTSNFCSDYCRIEQKKLQQCIADINRGYKRNLENYENKRNKYREDCQNDR